MASASKPSEQITILLRKWSAGDDSVLDQLIPLVYPHLKEIASNLMRGERSGHVFQPTALVNEAYLRFVRGREVDFESRTHFFAVAARIMRNILVDYAREQLRKKRGGGAQAVPLDAELMASPENPEQVLFLDEALTRLAKEHARKSRIVELHSFGGLTLTEAAQLLNIGENTAQRDWKFAKAWLLREFGRQHGREA